ncbi:growth arrest-specific protein 1-like [Lampetra fluviatilis]
MEPLHLCRVVLSLLLFCWAPLALSSSSPSSSSQQQQAARPPCWEAIVRCSQEAECKRAYDGYVSACHAVRGGDAASIGGGGGRGGALEGAGRHGGGGHGGGGGGSDDGWRDGDPAGAGAGRGGGRGRGGRGRAGGAASLRCPSLCITALVQLNRTRSGPALESCDCGREPRCLRTKSALEPCLPRTFTAAVAADTGGGGRRRVVVGCTDARHRCLEEPRCSATLDEYLRGCGQLFNGARCSPQCRAVIERMLSLQGARQLSDCVCDGIERPFCEAVKRNMAELCFDGEDFLAGSGDFGSYGGGGDDDDDDGDDDDGGIGGGGGVGGGAVVDHRHRGGGDTGGGGGGRRVDCPPAGAAAPRLAAPLLVAALLVAAT